MSLLPQVDVDDAAARLASAREVMRAEYRKRHRDPWVVAYSGGKDSTLLLHLAWEVMLSHPPEERRREIHVVANDTLVESPLVIRHLKKSLDAIRKAAEKDRLPVRVTLTKPCVDQTFWVNVIGRGYIPPTRNFRWCTDRMKIKPTEYVLEKLMLAHGRAALLVGTRRSESQTRRRSMKKRGVRADRMKPHGSVKGLRMFAPLADLRDEDVWMILMQLKPPWGGSHRALVTLYRNAGGGDCPLVLSKEDAPSCGTTSPRFGCWTCTVVKKDRSLRGLIDSGHEEEKLEALADFREWLIELRENDGNRNDFRRNGQTKRRNNGSLVRGPFKVSVRREILAGLRELERTVEEKLISQGEQEMIDEIWGQDEIRESARNSVLLNFEKDEGDAMSLLPQMDMDDATARLASART